MFWILWVSFAFGQFWCAYKWCPQQLWYVWSVRQSLVLFIREFVLLHGILTCTKTNWKHDWQRLSINITVTMTDNHYSDRGIAHAPQLMTYELLAMTVYLLLILTNELLAVTVHVLLVQCPVPLNDHVLVVRSVLGLPSGSWAQPNVRTCTELFMMLLLNAKRGASFFFFFFQMSVL